VNGRFWRPLLEVDNDEAMSVESVEEDFFRRYRPPGARRRWVSSWTQHMSSGARCALAAGDLRSRQGAADPDSGEIDALAAHPWHLG
jgi:hypothetical protein